MSAEIYEVIAQGMRYWFLFLMALIVWRCYRWYRRDRRERKRRLRLLPDAGYVGELVITDGGGVLNEGDALPVPREGTLGFLRTNDICVPVDGVRNKHLWFRFDDYDGLMVEPYGKNKTEVDGEAFVRRRDPLYMAHGSRLRVGEAELRLRLFVGFETAAQARSDGFSGGQSDTGDKGGDAAGDAAGAYAYPPMTPEQLEASRRLWLQWQAEWMAAQGIYPPVSGAGAQSMAQTARGAQYAAQGGGSSVGGAQYATQPILTPEQYRAMTAWLASGQNAGYGGAGYNGGSGGTDINEDGEDIVGESIDAHGDGGASRSSEFASYQAYRAWAERERTNNAGSLNDISGAGYTNGASSANSAGNSGASNPPDTGRYVPVRARAQVADIENQTDSYAPVGTNKRIDFAPASAAKSPDFAPVRSNQTVLTPDEGFYPPVGTDEAADDWAYAPYPDYEAEDDDLTDAMQPPKSAYVGLDDAELAKKKVWDRYLGRGRRR